MKSLNQPPQRLFIDFEALSKHHPILLEAAP